jgi:DNA-directed RNA polymerase specialized sigma24 family protein
MASCVFTAAQEIAPQAVSYAEKLLADPCVAMNLLEEAAATVSEAVRVKQDAGLPPIRDLRAYLYRAFLRKIGAKRQAEIQLDEAFEERFRLNEGMNFEETLEARLLLKQILCMSDRKTEWVIWERIEGRPWDEIAYDMAMSNRAARLHYSRALREIREAYETDPRAYMKKLRQAERKRQRRARLINLFQTVFALLFCRVAGAKEIFGARFRITYHEREAMLADVDNMFS